MTFTAHLNHHGGEQNSPIHFLFVPPHFPNALHRVFMFLPPSSCLNQIAPPESHSGPSLHYRSEEQPHHCCSAQAIQNSSMGRKIERSNAETPVLYLSAFDFSALRNGLSNHPQSICRSGLLLCLREAFSCHLLPWLKGQTMRYRILAHVVGDPAPRLRPKYFLKFHTKSHHIHPRCQLAQYRSSRTSSSSLTFCLDLTRLSERPCLPVNTSN